MQCFVLVYNFSEDFKVTEEVRRDFDEHGYVILKYVLSFEQSMMV